MLSDLIITTRLRLEPLQAAHLNAYRDFVLDNRAAFEPWSPLLADEYYTLDNQRKKIEDDYARRQKGQGYFWVARMSEGGPIVADVRFTTVIRGILQSCFLAYKVAPEFQNQGIATEMVAHTIRYMFDVVGLNRIEALIMPHNLASCALIEKLGFEYEGLAKQYLLIRGRWEDHKRYALVKPT